MIKTSTLVGIFAIVAIMIFSFGCVSEDASAKTQGDGEILYSPTPQAQNDATSVGEKDAQVEMFKFRGNTECYSCVKLGELADMVVERNFKDEIASGKLVYKEINAQAPENRDITVEYQVTAISLQIGTTINGVKTKENLQQVWYYLEDEPGFENYLKPILEKRLRGELN